MVLSTQAELWGLSETVLVDQGGYTNCIIALNQVPKKEAILFLRTVFRATKAKLLTSSWRPASINDCTALRIIFQIIRRIKSSFSYKDRGSVDGINLHWLNSPELALQLGTIFVSYGVIWPQMTSISPTSWNSLFS